MRIRWRGLELPTRVIPDSEINNDNYGRFTVEPFERGFGTTVGNSLRRILLSSLEGTAVTSVKIKGAEHEFTSIEGVTEDVTDVILNVKNMVVSMETDEPKTMKMRAEGPGEVTCDLIEADTSITIHNKDLVIATLTKEVDFDIDFTVKKGRGYVPASEQVDASEDQEVGVIPVDAIFSPVTRVRYSVEDTRVGQKTNYDKLTIEVWTNGTIKPDMALVEAAKILRKHLNPFVQYFELGTATASETASARGAGSTKTSSASCACPSAGSTSRSVPATASSRPRSTPSPTWSRSRSPNCSRSARSGGPRFEKSKGS